MPICAICGQDIAPADDSEEHVLSIGTQKGPPIGVQKGPPFGGPLLRVVGGRWWCSRADGAVGKWPAGATVGRVRRRRATYPQRRREVVELRGVAFRRGV